jgi:hypothetical protein
MRLLHRVGEQLFDSQLTVGCFSLFFLTEFVQSVDPE